MLYCCLGEVRPDQLHYLGLVCLVEQPHPAISPVITGAIAKGGLYCVYKRLAEGSNGADGVTVMENEDHTVTPIVWAMWAITDKV